MKYLSTVLSTSALLVSTVSAHGGVTSYSSGSTTWKGYEPYMGGSQSTIERQYPSYNPLMIPDLTSVNIRCNNPGTLGNGQSASIAAGSDFTAYWPQWTHAEGCVMVYMAKCPASGCNSWDGAGSVWFKIDQVGLISGTVGKGKWGSGLIMDTLKWTVKIPAALPSGEYLIRHELLALHQANNPQFYPECAQLTVTGGGSGSPSPLVSFPGAYSGSDPAVNMDIYSTASASQTSYTCPGPAVWAGAGGGGGASPPVSSSTVRTTLTTSTRTTSAVTTTRAPTAAPTTTTSIRPTTSAAAPGGCSVSMYGQCGGTGYTGCTTCVGSTCKATNQYYSQCL